MTVTGSTVLYDTWGVKSICGMLSGVNMWYMGIWWVIILEGEVQCPTTHHTGFCMS